LYPRLWIDLDNSPHVPLFAPLIGHLREQGWEIRVTARDFAQTLDLVEQFGLDAMAVGAHAGKNKVKKVANLPVRAAQLIRALRGFKPQIALSHGSRTQAIASRLLGVPQVVMFDYEWTEMSILGRLATHLLCPRAITRERLIEAGIAVEKVTWYDGFKEEMYLPEFHPDPAFPGSMGVEPGMRLITVRPPGLIGNYHDPRSEEICRRVMEVAAADPDNVLVVLPKTRVERQLVDAALPERPAARVLVPDRALPGLQLLYHSDVAVSGGGTMNRESALLGVKTYSIFTGRRAAIDEELRRRGLLSFIESPEQVAMIDWSARPRPSAWHAERRLILEISDVMSKFVGLHESS
jgi:predicted glycosyltransferase